jgi:hypothetical protein
MAISYFKKLHTYGQNLIYDKFQTKIKCVLEDSNKNQFIAYCLLSKYSDKNILTSNDISDVNKTIIKFRISELENLVDIKTKTNKLNYSLIKTVILDGLRYNVNSFEINNQSRDFLIMEITKFKS